MELGISGRPGQYLACLEDGMGAECVCVCVCVCPGGLEETQPSLSLHCLGEGRLGWQVTLGELEVWLPACTTLCDGLRSLMSWARDGLWLVGRETVQGHTCL